MKRSDKLLRKAKMRNLKKSISKGAYLIGPSHAEGGIKVVNKSNPDQPLEVEGGEAVITAPALEDLMLHEFEGKKMTKRQILSAINQDAGGVAFADGGRMPKKIKCSGKKYKYGGEMVADYDIVKGCGCKHGRGKMEKMVKGGQLKRALPIERIARLHKVKLPYAKEQLKAGMRVEAEHSGDEKIQSIIARQHLKEDIDYYKKLEKVEAKPDKKLISDLAALDTGNSYILQTYEGHPEKLLNFIQEQATGMTETRDYVDTEFGMHGYPQMVKLAGKDLTLRAVAAIPQADKDMLIKAWKGKALDPELRKALRKKTMKEGGEIADGLSDANDELVQQYENNMSDIDTQISREQQKADETKLFALLSAQSTIACYYRERKYIKALLTMIYGYEKDIKEYHAGLACIAAQHSDEAGKLAEEINRHKHLFLFRNHSYPVDEYEGADDEKLCADARRYTDLIKGISGKETELWGSVYEINVFITGKLQEFIQTCEDLKAAKENILQPMGIAEEDINITGSNYETVMSRIKDRVAGMELEKKQLAHRAEVLEQTGIEVGTPVPEGTDERLEQLNIN
jgi:hypothetical protein